MGRLLVHGAPTRVDFITEIMMVKKWMQAVAALIALAVFSSTAALAQGTAATRKPAAAQTQTDVAASFYQTITTSTTGQGTVQKPDNAIGGMFEIRHIHSSLIGYEMSYSFNPYDQYYTPNVGDCGYRCSNAPLYQTAGLNIFGFNWVVSKQYGAARPFAVGGLGVAATVPNSSSYASNNYVRPAFIGGGGVDYAFGGHFGVRAQVRANFFKAPALSLYYSPTAKYTDVLQPMGGVFYRF